MSTTLPSLPLANGRTRFLAGFTTLALTLLVLVVGFGVGLTSRDSSSWSDTLDAVRQPVLFTGGIWALMVLGLLAGTSATPGQWVFGVGAVSRATGEPSGARSVLKEAILLVSGIATAGLAPLVMLLVRDRSTGANLLDRLAGTLVVQRRGEGVPIEGAGFLSGLLHTQAQRRIPSENTGPGIWETTGPRPPSEPIGPVDGPPGHPVVTLTSGLVLLDQGTRLVLDRTWVLGRNPTPPGSHPGAEPFLVPDVDKTLSKSHLVLTPVPGGVSVTDLYSTNGVSVTLPDGSSQAVGGGRSVTVPFGTTVTWGARSLQVLA